MQVTFATRPQLTRNSFGMQIAGENTEQHHVWRSPAALMRKWEIRSAVLQNPKWCQNSRRLKTWQNVLLTAGEHWGLNGKMTACLHGNASIMEVGVGCWIYFYFFERFQVVTVCYTQHILHMELANSNKHKRMLQSQTDVFRDVERVWSG